MKLRITVDGKAYEIEVEVAPAENAIYGVGGYVPMSPVRVPAPPPAAWPPGPTIPAAPGAAPAAPPNEEKVCRSPISGIVVRVTAQPGQQIRVGDAVLVLEAMKMETDITAPFAGKIKSITVKVGDSVITSGLGGRFPSGFAVGTVTRLEPDDSRAFLVGDVRPAAQLDRGRDVLLLRQTRVALSPAATPPPAVTPPASPADGPRP
jgi:biotin carboxyl carrier protein